MHLSISFSNISKKDFCFSNNRYVCIDMMKFGIHLFQVYVNPANVDKYLIDSITRPADDPNAGEVYYRYELKR